MSTSSPEDSQLLAQWAGLEKGTLSRSVWVQCTALFGSECVNKEYTHTQGNSFGKFVQFIRRVGVFMLLGQWTGSLGQSLYGHVHATGQNRGVERYFICIFRG